MASDEKLHPYQKISDLMSSDDDFLIFRRFDSLNFCNLLHLQLLLNRFEEKLKLQLYTDANDKEARDMMEENVELDALMGEMRAVLKVYNKALLVESSLSMLRQPSPEMTGALYNFLSKYLPKGCLNYLGLSVKTNRFVCLGAERSGACGLVDKYQILQKVFEDKTKSAQSNACPDVVYYSEWRLRIVDRFFIPFGFCIFLLLPIILLAYIADKKAKLGVLAGFVCGCSLLSAGLLPAKIWEIMAITAGYCAILVVFIGDDKGT